MPFVVCGCVGLRGPRCVCALNDDVPFTVYELQFYNNGQWWCVSESPPLAHINRIKINRHGNWAINQLRNRIRACYAINTWLIAMIDDGGKKGFFFFAFFFSRSLKGLGVENKIIWFRSLGNTTCRSFDGFASPDTFKSLLAQEFTESGVCRTPKMDWFSCEYDRYSPSGWETFVMWFLLTSPVLNGANKIAHSHCLWMELYL